MSKHKKRGDPEIILPQNVIEEQMLEIARELAKRIGRKTVQATPLKQVRIEDDSVPVGYVGQGLPREGDFIIDDEGIEWEIKRVMAPPEVANIGDSLIEIKPAREVKAEVTIFSLTCENCHHVEDMEGYEVVVPPQVSNRRLFVVMCPTCGYYRWQWGCVKREELS